MYKKGIMKICKDDEDDNAGDECNDESDECDEDINAGDDDDLELLKKTRE